MHGVAVDIAEHFGQLDPVGERQEQAEHLGAADHRHRLVPGERQRLLDIMRDLGAVGAPAAVARQDDVPPPRQHPRQAVERPAGP